MREHERTRALLHTPQLLWDVLYHGRYRFNFDQMEISFRKMSRAKRWNVFRSGANLLHRRLRPWCMPLHMQFELTNYCNLHCPICPTGNRTLTRRPAAMDPTLFQRTIDEVGPYLLTASLWGWGESLLHPQLHSILRAIRRHPIASIVSTNGQNLDDECVIQAMIEEPPAFLIVALDGITDETNSLYRIGAQLAPALAGVRRLAELKRQRGQTRPVLHMRFLVMKHNQHEVPKLKEFAAQAGFDMLSYRTLSIIGTDAGEQIHFAYVPDQEAFRAYEYAEGQRIHQPDFICQQPFWFPTLFANGTLVACDQDFNAQESMGMLKDGVSFSDVWYSRQAQRVRRIIRDTPAKVMACRNCPFSDRPTSNCSVQCDMLNSDIPIPLVL